MSIRIILCVFLFLPYLSYSQMDSIRQLEKELIDARGVDRITKRLALSEQYFLIGQYSVADELAENAYRMASYDGRVYYMALALNRSGKAALAMKNNRKARKLLWDSANMLENTTYTDLLLENLSLLQTIAKQTARKSELTDLDKRIAAIQARLTPAKPAGGDAEAQKPIDLLGALEEATRALSNEVTDLATEKEALEQNLERRQREIEAMSQQQMEQELMLALQQNLLDSMTVRTLQDSLLLTQQNMQLQEQKAQTELRRSERNFLFALAALGILLAGGVFARYRGMKQHNRILEEKNQIIQEEQRRSEDLLLNILPAAVAQELKSYGAAQARHYDQVTVLFTDFQGFSKIASQLSPEQLVAELDYCFSNFDRIIEKYQLEKIKTIGDAYMCAGGLPRPSPSHPLNVVLAAIEIQRFLREWKLQKVDRGEPYFEARLGIHTGPIVAGVVGVKKFAYDIWGDTVNVAARMEANGEPGKINISDTTYQLIKQQFFCLHRGKVPAKNMGEIDMYYVEKPVGELAAVN